MSYFQDFVGKGNDRTFLVIVNPHGETMVSRLDKDGKPTTWAIAARGELVGQILQAECHDHKIIRYADDVAIHRTRGLCETWQEVADVFNGKGRKTKKIGLLAMSRLIDFTYGFIDWESSSKATLTERAIKADQEYLARQAKP